MAAICSLASHQALPAARLGGRSGSIRAAPLRHCVSTAQRRTLRPMALGGALIAVSGPSVVAQAASAVAWSTAIWMATRLFMQQESEPEDMPRRECESCGGRGYVECWCSRWSDGDRGCGTCRGSGAMVCNSCRGGGTAVPIEARIVIRKDERCSNFRKYK